MVFAEREQECPHCGKAVQARGMKAHIRLAHPDRPAEPNPQNEPREELADVSTAESVLGNLGGISPGLIEQVLPLLDRRVTSLIDAKLEPIIGHLSSLVETVNQQTQAMNQIPDIVRKATSAQLDQFAAAQLQGQQMSQASPQTSQGQPSGNLVAQLAPLIIQKALQPNPGDTVDLLTKQLEGLGRVIAAIDTIRGGTQAGGSPGMLNAALNWAKWGHDLAARGEPRPDFSPQTSHVPPTSGIRTVPNPPAPNPPTT